MVTLIKRTIKGHVYWYAVRSARVNGKPRIVWQKYLGTAEKIAERIVQQSTPGKVKVHSMPLGYVAAFARVNADLQFVDIIDRNTDKRRGDGLSVGQYILLQMMGRAAGALSRSAIAEWYPDSVARLVMGTAHTMNAETLLRQLDYPTTEAIRAIEDEVAAQLMSRKLCPSLLLWDTTNFFTRIEHGETLARKGHSKEHRNDRNLIGVGLAVGAENIPFFHETYSANEHDSRVFSNVLDAITARLTKLNVDMGKVVMVMDKGNNSEENIRATLARTHLIGTVRYDQAAEYIEVPLDKYQPIDGDGLLAYRTTGTLYGEQVTIVVTYNPKTARKQLLKYEETKASVLKELASLKERIETRKRRGRRWSLNRAIRAIVDAIPIQVRSVFDFDVSPKVGRGGGLVVSFGVLAEKEATRFRSFGKIVHFTDLHDWSSKEIADSYNAKYQVEDDFRWLKDTLLIPLKPVHVRTDQHVRSHVFICVMGLLFFRYLQWKLRQVGLEYTTKELDAILNGIRLAVVVNGAEKRTGRFVVEQMTRDEARVFSALNMAEFISL
jgi:transposase